MRLLHREYREVTRSEIEKQLKDIQDAEEVLDFLYGDGYGTEPYMVLETDWDREDKTIMHRLNMFWVVPMTLLLAPFMYLKSGQVGWNHNTKVGRIVLKLVGEFKE